MITSDNITISDLEELSLLLEELTEMETNKEKMLENFQWIESNKDYILLGAKYNDDLVGTLMAIICKDLVGEYRPFMVIENIVVKSTMRGKKIDKTLMNKIKKIAIERNCYYIMFVSSIHRKNAHKFYESMGYDLDCIQGFKKILVQ